MRETSALEQAFYIGLSGLLSCIPDLAMFRILGYLLLVMLLLALSFGWHPLAAVREAMGHHEYYRVRRDGINWELEYLRKRAIEQAAHARGERPNDGPGKSPMPMMPMRRMLSAPTPEEEDRERRERSNAGRGTSPKLYELAPFSTVLPPAMNGIGGAMPNSGTSENGSVLPAPKPKLLTDREGRLVQDVFQL